MYQPKGRLQTLEGIEDKDMLHTRDEVIKMKKNRE